MNHCGFTNGPCPNPKKCVFPRCDIEYSGSPVWMALKQVVTFNEAKIPKPPPPREETKLPDDSFD
jgi:hypothetical protein